MNFKPGNSYFFETGRMFYIGKFVSSTAVGATTFLVFRNLVRVGDIEHFREFFRDGISSIRDCTYLDPEVEISFNVTTVLLAAAWPHPIPTVDKVLADLDSPPGVPSVYGLK